MKKTLDEIRQYINEGVYDPGIFKAFFLAGGPGSGKTFVTQTAFSGTGLKVVNSDSVFERGLKKANLTIYKLSNCVSLSAFDAAFFTN